MVWLGLCLVVDALAAFGVVGCFNEEGGSRASRGFSPAANQDSPSIPKARMVLTSAVRGWESLSPIPGLPGAGDGGSWGEGPGRSKMWSHSPM